MYVQERVRLFWVRQSASALQRLSANVLREVCGYIDEELMLPRYQNRTLSLFGLASRVTLNFSAVPAFSTGAVLCYIGNFQVQCLGESTSTWILNQTGLRNTAAMAERRFYPGCIHYAHYVYAFGGSNATPRSAEKYSVLEDRWTALSPMAASRYAFSPVRQGQMIYLAEVNEASHLLEVFDTKTQSFTVLSSSLPFAGYSSIAYIFQSELVIIDFKGRRAQMKLHEETEFRRDDVVLGGVECFSQSVPVLLNRSIFFSQYKSGQLTRFSIDTGVFEVIS